MQHPWAVDALLLLGFIVALTFALGVLLARNVYQRLHYMAPIAMLAAPLIVAAVFINELFSAAGIQALLIGFLLILMNPVLTHATARAARIRALGRWKLLPAEMRPEGATPRRGEG